MKIKIALIVGIIFVTISLLYFNAIALQWIIPEDSFTSDPSEITMIGQVTEPVEFLFDITNSGEADHNVYYKISFQQGEIWSMAISGNQIVPEGQTKSFRVGPINLWFPSSLVPQVGDVIHCELELTKDGFQDVQYMDIPVIDVIVPEDGVINYFYADPPIVNYGETTVLHWETENMLYCFIDPYPGESGLVWQVELSGQREVTVTNNGMYELVAHPYEGTPLHAYVTVIENDQQENVPFDITFIIIIAVGVFGVLIVNKKVNV